jgi:hypothetical protein
MFKNSIKSLFIVGSIMVAAVSAQAQANFLPGYVVPLAGDTLRGEVDFRDSRANAQRVRFRANKEATVILYAPIELRAYGIPKETIWARGRGFGGPPTLFSRSIS